MLSQASLQDAAADAAVWNAIAAWVGCTVSLFVLAFTVVDRVRSSRRRARLRLVLTPDAFFRYGSSGELAFFNLVLVSTHRPALIRDVRLDLQQRAPNGDLIRSIPLELLSLGQPRDRGTPIHDHFFYSSSPIDLIPQNVPERRVYMCTVAETRKTAGGMFEAFEHSVRKAAAGTAERSAYETQVLDLEKQLIGRVSPLLLSKSGHFRLRVTASYSDSEFPDEEWTASASMQFEVRGNDDQDLQIKIAMYCRQYAQAFLTTGISVTYPEAAVCNATIKAP